MRRKALIMTRQMYKTPGLPWARLWDIFLHQFRFTPILYTKNYTFFAQIFLYTKNYTIFLQKFFYTNFSTLPAQKWHAFSARDTHARRGKTGRARTRRFRCRAW